MLKTCWRWTPLRLALTRGAEAFKMMATDSAGGVCRARFDSFEAFVWVEGVYLPQKKRILGPHCARGFMRG